MFHFVYSFQTGMQSTFFLNFFPHLSVHLFKVEIICTNTQTTKQYLKLADVVSSFLCFPRLLSSSLPLNLILKVVGWETSAPISLFLQFFFCLIFPLYQTRRYKSFLHGRWQVNNRVHQRRTLKLHAHRTNSTSLSSRAFVAISTQMSSWFPYSLCSLYERGPLYLAILSAGLMRAWWAVGPGQWTIWGTFSPLRRTRQASLTWLLPPSTTLHWLLNGNGGFYHGQLINDLRLAAGAGVTEEMKNCATVWCLPFIEVAVIELLETVNLTHTHTLTQKIVKRENCCCCTANHHEQNTLYSTGHILYPRISSFSEHTRFIV